jgi:hypothetical protein
MQSSSLGAFRSGRAEFLRVPYADFKCLRLLPDPEERQADYVMRCDIFPTD